MASKAAGGAKRVLLTLDVAKVDLTRDYSVGGLGGMLVVKGPFAFSVRLQLYKDNIRDAENDGR